MATTPTNAQQLESLITTVGMDITDFMKKSGTVLAQIGTLEKALQGLGSVNLSNVMAANFGQAAKDVNLLTKAFGGLASKMAAMNANANVMKTFGNNLGSLSTSIGNLTANATALTTLQTNLENFVISINGQQGFSKAGVALARDLNRIGRFVEGVGQLDVTKLRALPGELQRFVNGMNALNGVNQQTNLAQAVNNLARVANTMSVAGAGGPSVPGKAVVPALRAIPPAAGAASRSIGGLGYDMMRLQRSADSAGASLITLRYGLVGLGILGAFQFAMLDDALTRASAHARDFNMEFQPQLARAARVVSGSSLQGATELAKTLDTLMTAGLNQGGAAAVLQKVADFADASGMKAFDAAKKITDLMHAMGETGHTFGEFEAHLGHVSDLLVGVSRISGSTEQQMMEAFTSKFLVASQIAKLSIEESVTVLGLLSRAGEGFRGTKGGNIAARAIEQLSIQSVGGRRNWESMLGEAAHDAQGNIRPLSDLLLTLNQRMAARGTDRFIAELDRMKLGGVETLNAIEPLLRVVGGIKDMREQMQMLQGVTRDTADAIRKSMLSQLTQLWNGLTNVASVIGERLAPALYGLTQPLTVAFDNFTKWNAAFQNLAVVIGLTVLAFGPLRSSLMWFVSLAFSPITNLIGGIYGIGKSLLSLSMTVGKALFYMISGLAALPFYVAGAAVALGTTLYNSLIKVGENIYYVSGLIWHMGNVLFQIGKLVVVSVISAFTNLISVTGSVGGAIAAVLVGIGSFIVVLPVLVGGVIALGVVLSAALPLIAAVGGALAGIIGAPLVALIIAPLATIAIGIGQLAVLVGAGLAKAWEAMKAAARSTLTFVGDNVKDINTSLGKLWSSLRESGIGLFKDLASATAVAAGFLWNFHHNMNVLFDWIAKHGVKPFEMIVEASFKMLEDVGSNLSLLARAIGGLFVEVSSGIVTTFTMAFHYLFVWLRSQWWNIGRDIGSIFATITKNVFANFLTIMEAAFAIISERTRELIMYPMGRTFATKEHADRFAAARDLFEKTAIQHAIKNLRGPLDGMKPDDLKTRVTTGVGALLFGQMLDEMGTTWTEIGERIFTGFSDAFENMNPIFAAFRELGNTEMFKELLGKSGFIFDLPNVKQAKAAFNNMMGVVDKTGQTGPSLENLSGQFSMKESSSARFIFGGEELARIDYQQLVELRGLRKDIQMAMTQRGIPHDRTNTPTPLRTEPRPLEP